MNKSPAPNNTSQQWKSFGLTQVGNIREHNEDAFLASPRQALWIVADSMGGHASGEIASKMLIEHVVNFQSVAKLGLNIKHIILVYN